MKMTDVPFSDPNNQDRNYRLYKVQFQAPQGVGLFTWKVCLISDTFIGEEICRDLAVCFTDIFCLEVYLFYL
jgi:translocation protein SEC63